MYPNGSTTRFEFVSGSVKCEASLPGEGSNRSDMQSRSLCFRSGRRTCIVKNVHFHLAAVGPAQLVIDLFVASFAIRRCESDKTQSDCVCATLFLVFDGKREWQAYLTVKCSGRADVSHCIGRQNWLQCVKRKHGDVWARWAGMGWRGTFASPVPMFVQVSAIRSVVGLSSVSHNGCRRWAEVDKTCAVAFALNHLFNYWP